MAAPPDTPTPPPGASTATKDPLHPWEAKFVFKLPPGLSSADGKARKRPSPLIIFAKVLVWSGGLPFLAFVARELVRDLCSLLVPGGRLRR